jgi:hypothetical protein
MACKHRLGMIDVMGVTSIMLLFEFITLLTPAHGDGNRHHIPIEL